MQVFLLVLLTDEGSRAVAYYQERLAKRVGVVPEASLEGGLQKVFLREETTF